MEAVAHPITVGDRLGFVRRAVLWVVSMWSPQNRRFTVLAAAIVAMSLMTLGAIVGVAAYGTGNSTPLVTTILGFFGLTINQLVSMLRIEQLPVEVKKTRHDIRESIQGLALGMESKLNDVDRKINGNVEKIVHTAVEAERHQMSDGTTFPKSVADLEDVINRAVEKACDKLEEKQQRRRGK